MLKSIEGSGYMELPALDPQELAADVAKDHGIHDLKITSYVRSPCP